MLGHDLFPRDFIVSLDPPDNYFGATRVFSDDAERIVRHVDDHADVLPLKHPKDHRVTELPKTLEAAVRVFVVARAIRLARGHVGRHNSMLVNVSRFVAVQGQSATRSMRSSATNPQQRSRQRCETAGPSDARPGNRGAA